MQLTHCLALTRQLRCSKRCSSISATDFFVLLGRDFRSSHIPGRQSPHGFTSDIAKSRVRDHGSDSVTLESATFDDDERDTRSNTSAMQPTHTMPNTRPLATGSSVTAADQRCTRPRSARLSRTGPKPPAATSLHKIARTEVRSRVEAIEQRSCIFSNEQGCLLCLSAGMRRNTRRNRLQQRT
jgi:hypothetical protein